MPAAVRRSLFVTSLATDQVPRCWRENRGAGAIPSGRIASRILGMGDVLSLIEDIEAKLTARKLRN